MGIRTIKLTSFKMARPGTAAFRTVDVFPDGFASRRALKTINAHPELLASYFAYRWSQQKVFSPPPYSKTVQLVSSNTSICAVIEDNAALIKREDFSRVNFLSPQECRSVMIDEKVPVPAYPHAGRAIDISSRLDRTFMALDMSLVGQRKTEPDRPTFIPSIPLRIYEWMFRISRMCSLNERNMLDIGSGIGTVDFIASLFCRSATGMEIHPSLHACAVGLEGELRRDGTIDVPVNFICGNFLVDIDMSRYSFIFVYKPFFADPEKILAKLRETRPGTLILADMLPQTLNDSHFRKITGLMDYCQGNTAYLLERV